MRTDAVTELSKWPNRSFTSHSTQEERLSLIDCVDFSLMNEPGDLQGAKVNLLCINKLESSICSLLQAWNGSQEIRKLSNYSYATDKSEHVNEITEEGE